MTGGAAPGWRGLWGAAQFWLPRMRRYGLVMLLPSQYRA